MHIPPIYRPRSAEEIWSVIARHPLAILATNGPDVPHATQLPVVPPGEAAGDIVGQDLFGHMNRANPHWQALGEGTAGKLIFSGPGAYISPTLYRTDPAAPTWDFVTVHLQGMISPIADLDGALAVVRRTASVLESAFGYGWDQSTSVDYFRSIVAGVGAFTFRVTAAEAMFKLSQEKPLDTQRHIVEELTAAPSGSNCERVGQLISEYSLQP